MDFRELALVAFTILGQMSVGAFIVLGVVHFLATRKAGLQAADRLSDLALLAIGPVLVLGMLASLAHLGNPLNAYLAVGNVLSSWLSREILMGVLFAGLGFLFALMQWRKAGTPALRNLVALAAALIGVLLVFSMAMVYALPNRPSWNSVATPLSFFVTTFLLGALAIGAAFAVNHRLMQRQKAAGAEVQSALLRDALRWIALAGIILLGLEFITIPMQIASLAGASGAAAESAALMTGAYAPVLFLRLALVFLGVGILGVFVYQNATSPGRERIAGWLAFSAFALVFVAEVLGRFLFYATGVSVGI